MPFFIPTGPKPLWLNRKSGCPVNSGLGVRFPPRAPFWDEESWPSGKAPVLKTGDVPKTHAGVRFPHSPPKAADATHGVRGE